MKDISIYSPVYKEIKKLEREAKEAQFQGYVKRFEKILNLCYESVFRTHSREEVFLDLYTRYRAMKYLLDRFKPYFMAVKKMGLTNIPYDAKLSHPAEFIYNAFSIYGPAKLRKALDL